MDWTTQPSWDLIFWKQSEICSSLMPRLQSSTRIVRNPSSWAWKAVEAEEQEYYCLVHTTTPLKLLQELTDTDISGNTTDIEICAALVAYQLLQTSLAQLGVI